MLELKEKIVALCNESGLPIEAILFILKDVYRDAEDAVKIYSKQKQQKAEEEKIQKVESAEEIVD